MSAITWSSQYGDPRLLAWRFALVDGAIDDSAVGTELSGSWGALEIWVRGVNLCAHDEQGEQMQAAHWYLLPIAEWFVANWNPLFHEQRLPLPRISGAAATAERVLAQLEAVPDRSPSGWGLPGRAPADCLEQYQDWSGRHHLPAAAPESALPNVWLRRMDDDLEVSLGEGDTSLLDGQLRWTVAPLVGRVPVDAAARTTARALRGLVAELSGRGAGPRVRALATQLDAVTSASADDERLAWLVGLGGDTEALAMLRDDVDALAGPPVAPPADPEARASRPPVLMATPVATLFGSLSPTIVRSDLQALVAGLRDVVPAPRLIDRLDELAKVAPAGDYRGLPDGEAGGELGDRLAAVLPEDDGRIAVTDFVAGLGVSIQAIPLSDTSLRAVTLLHADNRALIAINAAYERGTAPHVVRFSLAHELAHLIYDRAVAGTLALASGPWTPPAIERRANGFAAGLLMPERLLRAHVARDTGWPADASSVARLARKLGVGITTLTERLPNAGLLSQTAAEALLDSLLDQQTS